MEELIVKGQWLRFHRIFREDPLYLGPIDELPDDCRHPHVLHVTVLLQRPQRKLTFSLKHVIDAVGVYAQTVSALASEQFYTAWCLTFGTARMFEDSGTLLSEEDKNEFLERPVVIGEPWGLRSKKRRVGASQYSEQELLAHGNLGAHLVRLEMILAGALRADVVGNPTHEAQFILEKRLADFKLATRGADKRGSDTAYLYRRLREDAGPKRLKSLYADQSLGQLRQKFESSGRSIKIPQRRLDEWETTVAALEPHFEMLNVLITMSRRANRLQTVVDRNLDVSGLQRDDDPVLLISKEAANGLMSFGAIETGDKMPGLVAMTRVALEFNYNAAEIYPSLGPLTLHLAASCAIGRRTRGFSGKETPAELWGLKGLFDRQFDSVCFPHLREARGIARSWLSYWGEAGDLLPPTLPALDGVPHMPIVIKRDL